MSGRSCGACAMRTRGFGWSGRSCERPRLLREGGRRAVDDVYAFIAAEKTSFPVAVMCRVLGVNRTGFHNCQRRAPCDRALTDAWLTERIRAIHQASRGTYGAPRIHAEPRLEDNVRVGR